LVVGKKRDVNRFVKKNGGAPVDGKGGQQLHSFRKDMNEIRTQKWRRFSSIIVRIWGGLK